MQFNIRKRTGEVVAFDQSKITNAIYKAAKAVGGKDRKLALELSNKVFLELQARFPGDAIPPVEAVQDIVEKVLIEDGHAKTAKAYIVYRKQHEDLRDVEALMNSFDLIHGYIGKTDWKVNENSNMTYSLQGLNNYIAGEVIANYWLRKLYPAEIGDSHANGDLHIHDLGTLGPYCVGWDLQDLLMEGFGHVSGKIDSKPAGHFRTALGQVVNFFYTLQGEAAGAQAFSSFDTLLAPFIRHDNLSYDEVKQCMQEFTFNVNVPTRVGFQCMSEDTTILTPDGWKSHDQLKVGDVIRTFNAKTGQAEDKPIKRLFSRHYKGKMYNLRNRIQDQLVTPEHRVVRKPFNSPSQEYVLEPIEKVLELKSPVLVPIAGANARQDAQISDDELRLLAWLIAEGTSEHPLQKHRQSGRITLVQSATANGTYCEEIAETLDGLGLEYGFAEKHGTQFNPAGVMHQWRMNAESSRRVHSLFGGGYDIKFVPPALRQLSQRQARLFLETYRKANGQKDAFKISVSDERVLEGLQQIACDAGYGFTTLNRGKTAIGNKPISVLRIIEHPDIYINEIREVDYEGIVWCPNTDNETVIAQRNGKAFVTGNTPFTNITMDLSVPKNLAGTPATIGGKPVGQPYGDYAEEMTMLNRAFAETMMEGDAKGRVFTFPIPTYNVTKDFPWESDVTQKIFEMTAKYGIPYFANFINSDMSTEDARSMCCRLRLDNRELRKRGGGLFGANPLTGCYDEETDILTENGWKHFADLSTDDAVFTLRQDNVIEAHKPNRLFVYDWNGEMYNFKTKSLDLLVTPNHRMVVDHKGGHLGNKLSRTFIEAQDFNHNVHRIPKQGIWTGVEEEYFELPQINYTKYGAQGKTAYTVTAQLLKIKMDSWLKFFGIWLAEGSYDNDGIAPSHGYRVFITQRRENVRKDIESMLRELPFPFAAEGDNYVICNKQLWTYLKQFGRVYDKHVPADLKKLSKRQLRILFDWMVKGDGHVRKTTGQINYWTSSSRLAGDLQEIVMKLGWLGTLSERDRGEINIEGRTHKTVTNYCLGVQKSSRYRLRADGIKKVAYNGKVYCCEVPNNTVMVRRHGKVSWCGNSIGVVTMNLPRVGYLSKNEDEFFERLTKLMDIARDSLELKRKILENFTDKGMYPYSKYYLRTVREATGAYWTNHFNTIGLVGMNEALTNLLGTTIATKDGIAFAAKTLDFMRDRLADYQEETGNYYNLEATPAEGTSYRLARSDKKKYPDILVANNSPEAKPFYTNSTQLPVNHTNDIFEALELQEPLQTRYTGGTVLHGFLGERIDWRAARMAVKRIAENYRLPYFTLTPTFSICPKHGYLAGEHVYCPICDGEIGFKEDEGNGRTEDEMRSVQQDSRLLAAGRPVE